ncbi:MAG: RNA methyltransferase [Gammaproteobacteria bacterium]|nr:RNA methyltransferase [Gammaproteobacteria bacterium]
MKLHAVRELLRAAGARPRHEKLALRAWSRGLSLDHYAHRSDWRFPKSLDSALPALSDTLARLATRVSAHDGADGSSRWLLRLDDGQTVESVLLLRDGVCVSSQVGCAVGCLFCMTGREGLIRHLTSGEIVAQVALARAARPGIRRVVFMGMGEPAHNIENVMEAIELLGTEGALGHKNLVFSTVGDQRVFERLPQGPVKPALALSLHTMKPDLRRRLLPKAPRLDPAELIELGERYARSTGYPIQYQWTLLEGINDGDDELASISSLLAGKYAVMNFIPYNTVDDLPYRRPSWERAQSMTRWLGERGVLAKVRMSAGQDVEGGCGQLRARATGGRGGAQVVTS